MSSKRSYRNCATARTIDDDIEAPPSTKRFTEAALASVLAMSKATTADDEPTLDVGAEESRRLLDAAFLLHAASTSAPGARRQEAGTQYLIVTLWTVMVGTLALATYVAAM